MTTIQRITRVFGWGFVVIAIWGAVLTGTSMDADLETASRLWGLFPINFPHNLVHLLLGLWGIAASRSAGSARAYAVLAGVVYIALSVLGLFAPEGFGLVPLGGNDIWLHAVLGVVLLVAGLLLIDGTTTPKVEPAPTRTVMPPSATTASSPEGTVTLPPAEPEIPESGAKPVEPEHAGSEGAAEGATTPPLADNVVDPPPRQPEDPPGLPTDDEREKPPETT